MSGLKVLIVGASVAGPTAAYWFAKAGAQVTIIERFPELRKGGQAIDIRTVGVTVMRKMPGMEAAVRAKRAPVDGFAMVTESGRPFATIKATGDADRQSVISEFEIFRGDLSRILFEMTRDMENVRYVFGEQVAALKQRGDGDGPIEVEFLNGYPSGEYDLVVAADGATSRTRAMGLGCGLRDYMKPYNAWAAYFTVKKDFIPGSKISQAYYEVPGRMYAVGADHKPGHNIAVLISVFPPQDTDPLVRFREASKQGDAALKDFVAKRFNNSSWKCEDIVKEMMNSDDFYASEMTRVELPSLSKGRFVLIGDAGYSSGPSGVGTSLAMVGAYLLAGEVSTHKGSIAAGLRAYEERMQPILKDMTSVPPFFPAALAPQTWWGLWFRNAIIIVMCWGADLFGSWFSWISGLFSSALAANDKYHIPDYEWQAEFEKIER